MKYKVHNGKQFEFNDPVECLATLLPRERTVGRLLQVRKGIGAFGTDQYLIRLTDGTLASFENVGLYSANDSIPVYAGDTPETEYTINGEYPEVGFIVENPKQLYSAEPEEVNAIAHDSADEEVDTGERYYLQNCGEGYLGNSPLFYSKNGSGYTQWIDEAKTFTEEAANKVISGTRGTHTWIKWFVEEIEAVAKRTVDIQDLRRAVIKLRDPQTPTG